MKNLVNEETDCEVQRFPASAALNSGLYIFAVLPEEIQSLWRRAATIKPLFGSDLQVGERGPESTDSEKEREGEMMEAAEGEDISTEVCLSFPSAYNVLTLLKILRNFEVSVSVHV